MKIVANEGNETTRWMSQHKHLNLDDMIDDINRLGPARFIHEGNNHSQKCMKVAKHELIYQRGDTHGKTLMHKIFIKKLLKYLSNQDKAEAIDTFNVQSYKLKIQESLQNKLD